MNIIVCLYS